MKLLEKIKNFSKEKKITLSLVAFLIVLTVIGGIVFANNSNIRNTKATSNEPILGENKVEEIPDVSLENTLFEVSEIEETENNVTIDVLSKLENYNLYYYIDTIDSIEDDEVMLKEEIPDNEYLLYENIISVEDNCNIYFKYELDNIYSNNSYNIEVTNILKNTIAEQPENEEATEEELKKEAVDKIDTSATYYIKVNYQANVVTIYKKDANNQYTIPVKAMVCSTGTATPKSGVYKIGLKTRWRTLFGGVYGQYGITIVGNILFHSVPYSKQDASTLLYNAYDQLGTSASAGCVRLTVEDVAWIYNNCAAGTQVEFYASSNPGPLGKPVAKKISSYENLRNWDPTDPAINNPWRNANIVEEKVPENNTTTNNETNNNNTIIENNTTNSDNNNSNSNSNNNSSNNVIDNNNTTGNESTNNMDDTNNIGNIDNNVNIEENILAD